MKKNLSGWFWSMIVILALFCLWGCDNQSYDADMEKQFTAETGHTWKEVERAVR